MADEKTETAAPASAAPAKQGGGAMKTILVLAIVLGLEGATVGLTMWLSGGPKEVSAVGLDADAMAEQDKLVEVLVAKDRFPNVRTGRNFLYDTEIYVTLKNKNQAKVTAELEQMQAQMKTDLATLVRKAEPEWFQEATLATLRRQVKTILDERFGEDADGEPIIKEVLITKCIPFRADF